MISTTQIRALQAVAKAAQAYRKVTDAVLTDQTPVAEIAARMRAAQTARTALFRALDEWEKVK